MEDDMAGVYLHELDRDNEDDNMNLEFDNQHNIPWQEIGYFDEEDERMSDDDDPLE